MGFITFGAIMSLLLSLAAFAISLIALLKKSHYPTWEIPLGEFKGYLTREQIMDMDADKFVLRIERVKEFDFPRARNILT